MNSSCKLEKSILFKFLGSSKDKFMFLRLNSVADGFLLVSGHHVGANLDAPAWLLHIQIYTFE